VPSSWNELIASIRDATLDGLSWHAVARHVAAEFHSPAVALYGQSLDAATFKETAVVGIDDRFVEAYKSHYSRLDNPWVPASRFWKPGVIRTEQALQRLAGDRHVLRRSGYFQDWIVPQGYRHSMGMVVDRDAGGYVKLTMYRSDTTGPYRRADVARFHGLCEQLRLLLDIAGHYHLARTLAHLSLRALDHLDFGVMLLDADGQVLEMNRFARDLIDGGVGLRVHDGKPGAVDNRADGCINALLAGSRAEAVTTLTLAPPSVAAPVGLALTAMSWPTGNGRLLFLTCPERAVDQRLRLLVERFGFTPVEVELARGLLQGFDLRRAGAAASLSYETSRWYLKQLFAKTDTHRQADLVRLLLATKAEIHLPSGA
jgi:DNA-binding CsgD family transcriptional regulator